MSRVARNIYMRKDGRLEGRYINGYDESGRAVYGYVYGKSSDEVSEKLSDCIANVVMADACEAKLTFGGVAERWLSGVSIRVKESTLARYRYLLEAHILPSLGNMSVKNINSSHIADFAQSKLQGDFGKGKPLSANSVRDLLTIIRSVLELAVAEKLIDSEININFPKSHQREIRVLSKQEQRALENVLLGKYIDRYSLGVLLCLYTGMRLGEVCALRWSDIDIDSKVIRISKTAQRIQNKDTEDNRKTRIIVDNPKTHASMREIPMPEFLAELLSDYKKADEFYVLSARKSHPADLRSLQNRFKSILSAANIESVNFHALRHTFATRCIEAGVDAKSLSEILGHANVSITLDRYVHSSMEQKRESMNKLTAFLQS